MKGGHDCSKTRAGPELIVNRPTCKTRNKETAPNLVGFFQTDFFYLYTALDDVQSSCYMEVTLLVLRNGYGNTENLHFEKPRTACLYNQVRMNAILVKSLYRHVERGSPQ